MKKLLLRLLIVNLLLLAAAAAVYVARQVWPARPTALAIRTDPADAEVWCDGAAVGRAPLTLPLAGARPRRLLARREGYADARRVFTPAPGRPAALEIRLEPLAGLALVHSSPTGAEVTVNGAFRGRTPFFINDLPPGEYRLRFTLTGFSEREMALRVADRVPQRVHADLSSDAARLRLSSEPSGATVRLDGVARGQTPCELEGLPGGARRLELELDGYQPHRADLELQPREVRPIHVRLAPTPHRLNVISLPAGGRVYLNDEFRGETPLALTNLFAGEYRLRVERPGYAPLARTVTLGARGEATEEFRLAKNSGKLVVVSEPAGADVLLDDAARGVTPTGETARVSDPLELDLLPAGTYRVQVRKSGYLPRTTNVELRANAVVTLHERLTRRFVVDTRVWIGPNGALLREGMLVSETPAGDIELQLQAGGTIQRIRRSEIVRRENPRAP